MATRGDCDQFFTICRKLCSNGFSAKCATSPDRLGKIGFNKDGCSCLCNTNLNLIPTTIQTTTKTIPTTIQTTTTTTTTTVTSPPTKSFSQTLLESHNYYRSLHEVPPLRLSQNLINKAQQCAVNLAQTKRIFHGLKDNFGENIFWANNSRGDANGEDAVTSWYKEINNWDFKNAKGKTPDAVTEHFTQVKKYLLFFKINFYLVFIYT